MIELFFENTKNMIVGIVILILIAIILYILFDLIKEKLKEYETIKEYEIKMPRKGDGKNFLYCPQGCDRGVCKDKKQGDQRIKGHCQFDFECQYCEDRNTHMFYVGGNFENERDILPTYSQPKIQLSDFEKLNKHIDENNLYVQQLNEKIKKENDMNQLFRR